MPIDTAAVVAELPSKSSRTELSREAVVTAAALACDSERDFNARVARTRDRMLLSLVEQSDPGKRSPEAA